MNSIVLAVQDAERPLKGTNLIYDRAGYPIDISGNIWKLNEPAGRSIIELEKFSEKYGVFHEALVQYLCFLIKNYSASEVIGNWRAIVKLSMTPAFQKASTHQTDLGYESFSELMDILGKRGRWRLHYIRKWYGWCSDQSLDGFSEEVLFKMAEVTIGGNEKGRAVLSGDAEEGPFNDLEIVAFLNKLKGAAWRNLLTTSEHVLLWLCISFGGNAKNLALLREEDFVSLKNDGDEICFLNIPRIKKGHEKERAAFKKRKLDPNMAFLIKKLISENAVVRSSESISYSGMGRALISRRFPAQDYIGSALHEYSLHFTAREIKDLVVCAASKLNVISPRTGKVLRVSPRRFRYTFATRLVREGASQQVVAEALDHSDLQNVQVYFDLKSDIVVRLDMAMALELGPISQAFLGHLVRSEKEATRGDSPSSRIYHGDRETKTHEPIGTCGNFSFCGLNAPLACYTCIRFQPWMEAPHDKVLGSLLGVRERRQNDGQDGRMVTMFDATIAAVADVIVRIDARKKNQGASNGS